jgi:hypothetical protein
MNAYVEVEVFLASALVGEFPASSRAALLTGKDNLGDIGDIETNWQKRCYIYGHCN